MLSNEANALSPWWFCTVIPISGMGADLYPGRSRQARRQPHAEGKTWIFPRKYTCLARFSASYDSRPQVRRDYLWCECKACFWPIEGGCSQRYPHAGYAQNYAFWRPYRQPAPVDRNGDSGRFRLCSGSSPDVIRVHRSLCARALVVQWRVRFPCPFIALRVFHSMHGITGISAKWMMVGWARGEQDDCLVNQSCGGGLLGLGKLAG